MCWLDGELHSAHPATATETTITGLTSGATYSVGVYPAFSSGEAPRNNETLVTTASNDTEAPVRPGWTTGPSRITTSSTVTLNWAPSTDNIAVTGYQLRLGTTYLDVGPNTRTHTFTNVEPGYYYSASTHSTQPATDPNHAASTSAS